MTERLQSGSKYSGITLTVRMFSNFSVYLPEEAVRDLCIVRLQEPLTAAELMKKMNIPEAMPRVITVNDENKKEDILLQDGDVLKIFPVAMGG